MGTHDDAVAATVASDAGTAPTVTPAIAPTVTPAIAPTLAATPAAGGGAGPRPPAADAGRYARGALLGRGGMGEVRIARDERVGRDVAIKSLIVGAGGAAPEAVARFLREARVQGRLDHPAIVPVHDLGVDGDGVPFFAMKRLTGTTLADILSRLAAGDAATAARWPRRTLLARLAELALAIEFAHTRGVIHRDLKPHNVMLGDFGEVYVLDWGVARLDDDAPASGAGIQRSDLSATAAGADTAAGAVLGTPGYMAPEQARGAPIDHRVDVYALGCILFEVLALEPMLPRGVAGVAAALTAGPGHPAARRPDLDIAPELDDACARATAPDPAARFASALAFQTAIQRYLDGDRDLARRRELADELARRAATLLAAGDRAQAMRAAGRALALDPEHDAAAALVGRLLLEPPAETPAAVVAEVERAHVATAQRYLRVGSLAYLGYLLFTPGLLWVGVKDWTAPLVLCLIALGNAAMTYLLSRSDRPVGRWTYVALITDGTLVALTSVLFSPLLVVPGLATASALTFLASPSRRSAVSILIAAPVVMLTPLVLEWLGVLPRTLWIDGDGIHIRSWALHSDPLGSLVVVVGANLGLMFIAAQMAIQLRRAQREADVRTHLTAWHLRQLMPDHAPPPPPR